MKVGRDNNLTDKNISKSKNRYKIHVWFYNDIQPFLKRLAIQKGLTQIDLVSGVLLGFLIKERKNHNDLYDVIDMLQESKELYKLDLNKKKIDTEDLDRIKHRLIDVFNILKNKNQRSELLKFESIINNYLDRLQKRQEENEKMFDNI